MCRNGVLCVAYKQAHWMTQAWVGTNVASGSEFDLQIHERSHVPPKTARSWRVSAKVIYIIVYGWLPPDYQLSPAVAMAYHQWYIHYEACSLQWQQLNDSIVQTTPTAWILWKELSFRACRGRVCDGLTNQDSSIVASRSIAFHRPIKSLLEPTVRKAIYKVRQWWLQVHDRSSDVFLCTKI